MADRNLTRLACRLAADDSDISDRVLLDRFTNDRDEAAFETLIRRHERTVRAAVGRVLSDPHDAADAAQATFLVLVRRARHIDWRADLGPWLYGVAHRIAVRAIADRGRRTRAEAGLRPHEPVPPPDLSWREACDHLHAELDRLPERYRLPLLLCYLEGKTRDEAATALGRSVGTVKGQVRRGLALLRARLDRRGVTLSAGLLSAVAAGPSAAVTPRFAVAVVEAARGAASVRVAQLVREAVMGMVWGKVAMGIGVTAVMAGLGAWLLAGSPGDEPAARSDALPKPAVAVQPVETDAEVRGRLANLWKRQDELMRRGRFEVLVVRRGLDGKLTRDELHQRLARLAPHDAPRFLQQLLDDMVPPRPGVTYDPLCPFEVRIDGLRRLEKRPIDGSNPPSYTVSFTDGRSYVEYEPRNKQASAYDPYITVIGVGNMRHLPIPSGEQLHTSFRVVSRNGGRITLRQSGASYGMEVEADERTGFVYANRIESSPEEVISKDGATTVVREWLQVHPATDAAGRIMPALRVEANYSNGKLNSIDAVHAVKAEWDIPFTDADFAVPAPAGTYVFDHRRHHGNPRSRSVREAIPDVLAFANNIPDDTRMFWPILPVGTPAPKLDAVRWLPRDGKPDPPDMSGKVVFIDFWSLDCGPCIGEVPKVREAVEKHKMEMVFVGLHAAGHKAKDVTAFAEKHGLTYPLAIDQSDKPREFFGTTFRAYGVRGVPAAAVIDRDGKLAHIGRFNEALAKVEELLAADKPAAPPADAGESGRK